MNLEEVQKHLQPSSHSHVAVLGGVLVYPPADKIDGIRDTEECHVGIPVNECLWV